MIILTSCSIINFKKNRKFINSKKESKYEEVFYSYKPSATKLSELCHTKLEVKFNLAKKKLMGKATLTLKPYFYPQDSVVLDAKGFDIADVQLLKGNKIISLKYRYDSTQLTVNLDSTYTKDQKYVLLIEYTADSERLKSAGGQSITSDQGLFFISPDSFDLTKPTQVWTQGEPESSSYWFPTIDSPNQKTTQEMFITVHQKYKTLSNGELIYSIKNLDSTRTDYWKMDLPHAPYLFMMAIGDFSITKDQWKGKEVSYYTEPSYQKYARKIFGKTPEMIEFFSNKLKYKYPWPKYASVVVRDYVSGAMENTSATIFMEGLQKTDRELLDDNMETIQAHELFHHWFGDLVTCESWANLPLNESFATYGEYLWEEHKRGEDAAEIVRKNDIRQYLSEVESKQVHLIRFYNKDAEDMFDSHSYAKGGAILHMLRKQVGDDAFFESLNLYLRKNEFKTVEIHQLRLAFEEITGEDLNWFFNQWFLASGHPILKVKNTYTNGRLTINIEQNQDSTITPIYQLPVKINIWVRGIKKTVDLNITQTSQQFIFPFDTVPNLVFFDSDQAIVGVVSHTKTIKEWVFQYENETKYLAREDALENIAQYLDTVIVRNTFYKALEDPFWKIRQFALVKLGNYKGKDTLQIRTKLELLLPNEKNRKVKTEILSVLGNYKNPKYSKLFISNMYDSSYALAGAALLGYLQLKPTNADSTLKFFEKETNRGISEALAEYYTTNNDSTKYEWFVNIINTAKPDDKFYTIQNLGVYLLKSTKTNQEKGSQFLLPIAEKSLSNYIKYSAYKSLVDMGLKSNESSLKRIKENEKSTRLKEIYENL